MDAKPFGRPTPTSSAVLVPGRPVRPAAGSPMDGWFGFNPHACVRGLVTRRLGRTQTVVLSSVDFGVDRFEPGMLRARLYDLLGRRCCLGADARIELTAEARAAHPGPDYSHRFDWDSLLSNALAKLEVTVGEQR